MIDAGCPVQIEGRKNLPSLHGKFAKLRDASLDVPLQPTMRIACFETSDGSKTSDVWSAMCIAENDLREAMRSQCDLRSRCRNPWVARLQNEIAPEKT